MFFLVFGRNPRVIMVSLCPQPSVREPTTCTYFVCFLGSANQKDNTSKFFWMRSAKAVDNLIIGEKLADDGILSAASRLISCLTDKETFPCNYRGTSHSCDVPR